MDIHAHDFRIMLQLRAERRPSELYGLDMVNVEQQLKHYADQFPPLINDHPQTPKGTTEEMCEYFSHMPLGPHIQLLAVSVSECPERVTRLIVQQASL